MERQPLQDVFNRYKSHPEFLGIDIEDPNQKGAVDNTLLHLVSRNGDLEAIRVLTEFGAEINASGDLGFTPLHLAAMKGNKDAVKMLLELGANPRLTNEWGQTPADVAKLGGHAKLVDLLRF